jgi:PAS domain S-box-containing protein
MKEENDPEATRNLDDEIEEFLGNRLLGTDLQLTASEAKELIHELKSQQLRLETVESELRLAKEQLKDYAGIGSELSDNSSLGSLTLNRAGFIIEANRAASLLLNQDQLTLKNTLLDQYLSEDSKSIFKAFLDKIFTGNARESCEVTLKEGEDKSKFVYLTGVITSDANRCLVTAVDITGLKSRNTYRDEAAQLVRMVNTGGEFRKCMSDLMAVLRKWSECEAVGLRLNEGDDYPYFVTSGFPDVFVHGEYLLCHYGLDGKPEFEYISGNILSGGKKAENPYFTLRGSFWSNNTTDLLLETSDIDYQSSIVNQSNKAGYESLAFIPLRSGGEVLGFLQLNDHQPDRFTLTLIGDFERIADYLALTIAVRKIKDASKRSEKRLSEMLECIGDAVIVTDKTGKIIYINGVAEDLTGWKRKEAINLPVNDVFKISGQRTKAGDENSESRQSSSQGAASRTNLNLLIVKDGHEIPVDGSRVPVKNKKGKTKGVVITFRDISERKNVEELLIKAREVAEESNCQKSAFLANMSHEIRTPMNGILGFAELLKDPKITEEERLEYIGIIEKSGERMLSIINDIINISKVESGQMPVSITETSANEQVDFIYNFFKHEAEKKGINLLRKTPLSVKDSTLKTDKEKVYAILTNLVKNAIKFTKQGYIELGYERKGKYLEFYVKDTGHGIPREKIELVFERFRQVPESHNGNHEGSGLGLSISKAYVEMLGGEIWVDSQVGQGTTFFFTLPYDAKNKDNEADEGVVNLAPADKAENHSKKLKILIVDDDDVSTLFLTKVIGRYSREILKVRTGNEAVEACQKYSDIDLILMDIQMPEMDGYRATELIRRFDKDVIIIAQTAYALYNDSGKAIQAGCNDYIAKPINQVLLNEIINKYFSINDKEFAQSVG